MTGPTPTLRGRRVALRPYARGFSAGEVDRFLSWALDEEVVGLAGGSPLQASPERFRELFIQRMPLRNTDREQQFAVLDETGELIGRTGLFGIDAEDEMDAALEIEAQPDFLLRRDDRPQARANDDDDEG